MKQFKGGESPLWVFMLVITVIFMMGCAGAPSKSKADASTCITGAKLDKSISSEVQLEEFSCSFKKFEGAEVVHFKVAVKNITDKPQRFRVHIFLDNGKAVGGLIPRSTKKGLVNPGQTASFVYPVNGMTYNPKEIMLKISTVMP